MCPRIMYQPLYQSHRLKPGRLSAGSASLDLIVSPLVLDYIVDLPSIYKEFCRVLRSPGHLVFSIGHPFGDFLRQNEGSYFETRLVSETWRGFGVEVSMLFFRRSLEEVIGPLFSAGFCVDSLLEPPPTEAAGFHGHPFLQRLIRL